jgi:Tol biopolymer transport system component
MALIVLGPGLLERAAAQGQSPAKRPMTFLDMQHMRQAGSPAPSPDGAWMLYTISTPDWKEAKRQTDIFLVSLKQGLASTKQMTWTKEKNETSPTWLRDSSAFIFASNRDAPASAATQNQLYLMRPDGGEARRITDPKDGVSTFALSKDGRWLVYRSGKAGEEQLYKLPVTGIDTAKPEQLTKQAAGVGIWRWAPDGRRIYFLGPEKPDTDEKQRREKKFTVEIRNAETPLARLWALDLDTKKAAELTTDPSYTVADVVVSDDSRWIGFRGIAADRYKRNITEQNINADPYLLEAATGRIERLVTNVEVGESGLSFSPDSRWVAFSAPDDLTRYSMKNQRVYVRAVTDRGGKWRKLGASFDGAITVGFWSKDGNTIYFNEGIRATNQFLALDVQKDAVRQLTSEKASVSRRRTTPASPRQLLDGTTPPALSPCGGRQVRSGRRGSSLPTPTRRCATSRSASRRKSPGSRRTARWWAACWSSRRGISRASAIRSLSPSTAGRPPPTS